MFRSLFIAAAASMLAALLPAGPAWAQTAIKATDVYYSRLQNTGNWVPLANGNLYYRFSTTQAMPNSRQIAYTYNGATYPNMTRVGSDGQCVSFLKEVTLTTGTSTTSWAKGDPVVVNSQIATIPGGTAIATFGGDGRYNGGHCVIVLARLGDTLVVADQNYITGLDRAQVVGRHSLTVEQLKSYYTVKIR